MGKNDSIVVRYVNFGRMFTGTTRKMVGGWSFTRGTGPSDYIEILVRGNLRKGGQANE